jgi:hypothetical protein
MSVEYGTNRGRTHFEAQFAQLAFQLVVAQSGVVPRHAENHCSSSASIGERPKRFFCWNVHLRRTISRCQLITFAGLNSRTLSSSAWREWLALCFNRKAKATSGTFCQRGICGPHSCFRSTIRSCCRINKISRSFSSSVIQLTTARSNTKSHTNRITRKNIFPHLHVSLPNKNPASLAYLWGFSRNSASGLGRSISRMD